MFSFTRTKTGEQRSETDHRLSGPSPKERPAAVGTPFVVTEDVVRHLRALGLPPTASWEEATAAHRRLVSDLTPGTDASHRNVQLANEYLQEVNQAYASLRVQAVA